MKAVDPEIRIFWNNNHSSEKAILTFLANDEGTSDGLETHGKWAFGGKPKHLKAGTFEEWLQEVPLVDRKNNRKWRFAANEYRAIIAKTGRKNYLIANNEYGIGKVNPSEFNRYTYGLLMTDMLQEHFLGNWDMTCFWDTMRGDQKGLISQAHQYRLNPFHLGMELLAEAQGGQMLEVKTDNKLIYGFASLQKNEILLYLINKTISQQDLNITMKGKALTCIQSRIMQDTPDHWGEIVPLPVQSQGNFQTTPSSSHLLSNEIPLNFDYGSDIEAAGHKPSSL